MKVAELDTLVKNISLYFEEDLCWGCGMCKEACPKEAIELGPVGAIFEGTTELPKLTVDPEKCVLCGICDPICPFNALKLEVDGKREIPIVDLKGFPTLLKKIEHDKNKCELCGKCVQACPIEGAIKIEDGKHVIDIALCITCPWCEDACPKGAIRVRKVVEGYIKIHPEGCPRGCTICVKVCPAKAIYEPKPEKSWERAQNIALRERYCIYCGACVIACPVQEDTKPIEFCRTSISHAPPTRSMAWHTTLDKLILTKGMAKELRARGLSKASDAIKDRMLKKQG